MRRDPIDQVVFHASSVGGGASVRARPTGIMWPPRMPNR